MSSSVNQTKANYDLLGRDSYSKCLCK